MATLGKSALGGSTTNSLADIEFAQGPYVAASSGTTTDINIYDNNGGQSAFNLTLGIWADNAGVPGALLATSPEINWGSSIGYVTASITLAVTNGVSYWIGFRSNRGFNYLYDAVGSEVVKWKVSTYASGTLPDPFGTPDGGFNQEWSLYVTYTPSGGVPPLTIGIAEPTIGSSLF